MESKRGIFISFYQNLFIEKGGFILLKAHNPLCYFASQIKSKARKQRRDKLTFCFDPILMHSLRWKTSLKSPIPRTFYPTTHPVTQSPFLLLSPFIGIFYDFRRLWRDLKNLISAIALSSFCPMRRYQMRDIFLRCHLMRFSYAL